MSVKEDLFRALHDAVDWQLSLADAWSKDSAERKEALEQAEKYRAVLRRRYGTDKTAMDELIMRGEMVSIAQLRERK
jgi:hypothetical protein